MRLICWAEAGALGCRQRPWSFGSLRLMFWLKEREHLANPFFKKRKKKKKKSTINKLKRLVRKLSPSHTFSSLMSSFLLSPKNNLLALGGKSCSQQSNQKCDSTDATCLKSRKNKRAAKQEVGEGETSARATLGMCACHQLP